MRICACMRRAVSSVLCDTWVGLGRCGGRQADQGHEVQAGCCRWGLWCTRCCFLDELHDVSHPVVFFKLRVCSPTAPHPGRLNRPCAAAVGLSYSGVRADYSTNDTATAADSNAFLRGFFRRYPHLAGNDFYISGGKQQAQPATAAAV